MFSFPASVSDPKGMCVIYILRAMDAVTRGEWGRGGLAGGGGCVGRGSTVDGGGRAVKTGRRGTALVAGLGGETSGSASPSFPPSLGGGAAPTLGEVVGSFSFARLTWPATTLPTWPAALRLPPPLPAVLAA